MKSQKKRNALLVLLGIGVLIGISQFLSDPNISIDRYLFNRVEMEGNLSPSKKHLEECIGEGIPDWIQERVNEELKPFTHLKREGIKRTLKKMPAAPELLGVVHYRIENGKVSIEKDADELIRTLTVKESLETLCKLFPIPDMDLLLSVEDTLELNPTAIKKLDFPIFVFARAKDAEGAVLFPHFSFFSQKIGNYCWIGHVMPHVEKYIGRTKWSSKKEAVFWRGATTGMSFFTQNWEEQPRVQICQLSRENPLRINAKFSYLCECMPGLKKEISRKVPTGKYVKPGRQLEYKYLLSLDGNTCTSPGLYWRLLSDSVVFKQETDQIEYFYHTLVPYEHYVPLKRDLTDIHDKFLWAKNHDEEMREMAKKSSDYVYSHLTLDMAYLYLYHLLQEYAKLFDEE